AAVGVAVLNKDTEAFLGANNTINGKGNGAGLNNIKTGEYQGLYGFQEMGAGTFHGVAVQASSSENIFGLTASVGGGFVGIAGAVAVTIIHLITKAIVGGSTNINGSLTGVNAAQSINIAAADSARTFTIAGGIGGGFVGVAAGIDIGVLDVTVQTVIGTGATLRAADDVSVIALSRKNVQTYALSVGGGFVGAAGAVSVWSVGTQATTTYDDDGGGETKGEWASGTIYGKGDVVTFGGNKYYATETTNAARLSQDPTVNTTDWDPVETKQPLQTSDGNAVSDSDDVAKGDGGYKNTIDGASVRDAGAFSLGADYRQGDVVTYSGQKYVARMAVTNAPVAPTADLYDEVTNPDDEAKWGLYTAS